MNTFQYSVFLKYWGMGSGRSLEKLHDLLRQETAGVTPQNVPAVDTLKNWSKKFSWQVKISDMDEEANKKLFDEAIGAAREARVDILKIFKAVVLRFAKQLKDDPSRLISSGDIAIFWKMVRVEMNLPDDGSIGDRQVDDERRFTPIPPEMRDMIMKAFRAWGMGELPAPTKIIPIAAKEIKTNNGNSQPIKQSGNNNAAGQSVVVE